ncbi:MAG TPA: hypothetical protein VNR68_11690 [Sphingomicrobium sp.]|nr:hypothetical protein [Sphingomicrobium sp.]
MNRIPMSAAAAALLRALIARACVPRDRILLTDVRSVDWQSLTFVGERHEFQFRITGLDSSAVADRLCRDLEETEFSISGQIVADVTVAERLECSQNGFVTVKIQALTIAE